MTREVAVSIRGYRVAARARPAEFRWLTGDNHAYTTTRCGSEPDPAADGGEAAVRHVYQDIGNYKLQLEVVWVGSYTFAGHGRGGSGDLGAVTAVTTRVYPVHEIRSVLID